jgi:hypothetical protein
VKNLKFISLFAAFFCINSIAAERISADDAPFYTGNEVIACGQLMQVSRFKRGLYLNLEKKYPNQPLTLIVWEDDLTEFTKNHGNLNSLVGYNVCGEGKVAKYKGRSQISLYNSYSLKVIK